MLDSILNFCVRICDAALGWTLALPSDLTLFVVSLLSAFIVVILRKWTTPQELLHRCADDKKQLKELIRQAKAQGDKDAVQRHKLTRTMVGARAMRYEWWPLLAALGPILLIWIWGFERLDLHPPRAGEPVELAAYFPVSAAGSPVHLLTPDGVKAEAPIRPIEAREGEGVAKWKLTASARPEPYTINIAYEGKTYSVKLLVGQRIYQRPVVEHDSQLLRTQWMLPTAKLLGLVPAIEAAALPAWMLGYIILVVPMVILLRRWMGVR